MKHKKVKKAKKRKGKYAKKSKRHLSWLMFEEPMPHQFLEDDEIAHWYRMF